MSSNNEQPVVMLDSASPSPASTSASLVSSTTSSFGIDAVEDPTSSNTAAALPVSSISKDELELPVKPEKKPQQQQSGDLATANRLLRACRTKIDQLTKQLAVEKEETARIREEFNKHKVRTELARKNTEMEISSLADVNRKFKQYNVVSHDVQAELEALRRRYEVVERERTEARADASKLRELLARERAERDRTQHELDEWKRRAEFIGPEALAKAKEELSDELSEVRREFKAYRNIMVKTLEEKEAEIVRARTSSEAATEMAYLRDVIIKYIASSNDPASKMSMEAAIASVLRFNQAEVDFVKEKRRSDAGWKHALSALGM